MAESTDFSQLYTKYPRFFEHLETPPNSKKQKYGNSFIMSIDAEWYEYGGRNIVLSYQIATTSKSKTNNIIKYMEHGKRLTLTEIVELGIQSVTTPEEFSALRGSKAIVVLISHNTVAEWSVLADRDEPYITKRLALVRNSPITDGHPIKLVVGKSLQTDVLIYDTMLLSPATHRGLKKLSSLLGDKEIEKDPITQFYIEHMNLYLQDHPDKYRAYALKDSEVTLRLFFILQDALNELVGGEKFKLYRTLASAGVTGFLNKNDWYDKYKDIRTSDKFFKAYQLVKRSYYGGRNEGFFIGHTSDYPETKNKIWLDIDFSGCYPTSMALCPKLDFDGSIDYIPYSHEITDETVAKLLKDHINIDIITKVREALSISPDAFDKALVEINAKTTAWKIRKAATKIDNRLVDKWYQTWQEAKENNDTAIEQVITPGFARVRFKFPEGTQFPCLPIRHEKYGLLYVLEGETTVTASEIVLALDAGATIESLTSVELPIEYDDEGKPVRFVLEHLADLTKERNKYKVNKDNPEHQVREKLVKEFMNSFYGKFSQSINPRNVYKPATGEMVALGKSNITEPCTAALVTSLARAALSATLIGVEKFNKGKKLLQDQITVVSATTDGLLMGIPATAQWHEVQRFYKMKNDVPKMNKNVDKVLVPLLKKMNCSGVVDEINQFLSIQQMRNSRKEMTGKDEIFEIKHLADEIVSIKTRGQIGLLNSGHTSLLARFGHKPPLSEIIPDPEEYKRIMEAGGVVRDTEDTKWINGHLDRIKNGLDKIEKYTFITLTSFRKMIQSNGKMDLLKLTSKRNINMDFDWKRKLDWQRDEDGHPTDQVSPFTVPHYNVSEMFMHRNQMESIRRTGYVARPASVLHRVKIQGRTIRCRGGEPVTVARLFIRGVLNGNIPLVEGKETYSQKAAKINQIWKDTGLLNSYDKVWGINDFKNNKDALWEDGCILPNRVLENLVEQLAITFNADPGEARKAIFFTEDSEITNIRLIEQVISATVHASKMGIEPFVSLQQKGLLPDQLRIRDTFRQRLSEEEIEHFFQKEFIPGQLPAGNVKKLKKLFYSLGIPQKEAEECAKVIATKKYEATAKIKRRNPGEKKCTDHFTLAILQADIKTGEFEIKGLWARLQKFGLTRNRYYELKKSGNFRPNCITDTQFNRQQINRMAKAVGVDPTPLLQVLIST